MRQERQDVSSLVDAIGADVVDAALEVHRTFGPGLLEAAYETCLVHELERRDHKVDRQLALPVIYRDVRVDLGYRMDLVVDDVIVVEVKAVEQLLPVHEAQLLTYLRLSSRRLGYLINFNVPLLKQGIRRRVLTR
ncbi:MAG: GxxExxY protein [Alphaproteobacteria bacterium]